MDKIELRQPLENPRISQLFDQDFPWYNKIKGKWELFYKDTYGLEWHPWIDYACIVGTHVYSANDWICMYANYDNINGNLVQIWNEEWNYKTLYWHNSKMEVKQWDKVKAWQLISLSGNTWAWTWPHLHFGFKLTKWGGNWADNDNGYNWASDPMPFIKYNYLGEILNINNDMFTYKKLKWDKNIWLCNEDKKIRAVFLDMPTMAFFTDNFDEVDNLDEYKVYWTQALFQRTIID